MVALPDGWLTEVEADALAALAKGKRVLELGAYKGRSTIALATTAREVVSVDWHKGDANIDRETANGAGYNTLPEFLENIKDYPNITPLVSRTEDVAPLLVDQTFDMVWIDANHTFTAVQHDWTLARSFKPAIIAIHDWGLFQIAPAMTALSYAPNRVIDTVAIFELDNLKPALRPWKAYNLKLVVAIPFSGRYVAPEWAMSMMNLRYPQNATHGQFVTKGMPRQDARVALVDRALTEGAEYIFFVDDDTSPPFYAISKLLQVLDTSDKDVMVCGGIYTTKQDPIEPLVFLDQGSGPHWKWKFGDVFPCWGLGTGCMLIRTEVFKHIPKPWFRDIYSIEDVGEDNVFAPGVKPDSFSMTDDLYFCKKVNDAGFKVIAHGGVLPVHWDQQGTGHVLPDDAYPLKGLPDGALWYKQYYVKKG